MSRLGDLGVFRATLRIWYAVGVGIVGLLAGVILGFAVMLVVAAAQCALAAFAGGPADLSWMISNGPAGILALFAVAGMIGTVAYVASQEAPE